MEFHEKLQELRKSRGLTQEELAAFLFVSRTAISKWESARGYPNIDSLKAIAKFYSVSIDDLLSGDEILTLAETDARQKQMHFRDLIFGLLDCCVTLLLFLPFFGRETNGVIQGVSLLALNHLAPYLRFAYVIIVTAIVLSGILLLALQNCRSLLWSQCKYKISIGLSIIGAVLFIISLQPYAAVLLFVFLLIKVFSLIKWR